MLPYCGGRFNFICGVVVIILDIIDHATLEYRSSPIVRGGFNFICEGVIIISFVTKL